MAGARAKMAAAFEFFTKLGTPYYCFHDRDVAPEGATFAEFRDNLDALADEAAGLPGADRRPAAVGHREPVHPPALPGGRRDQPRPRGVRLRRGAGQAHARGHPAPGRRELRAVGRPRGLRHAAQHRPPAGGRAARPVPPPGRRAQGADRVRGPAAASSPSPWSPPSTSTTPTPRPSTASSSATGSRASTRSTSRPTTRRSRARASTTRWRSRPPTGILGSHRRQPGRPPERLGHRPVPQLASTTS